MALSHNEKGATMSGIKQQYWLDPRKAALVVIDVQEKLAPAMDVGLYQKVEQNLPLLIEGCKVAEIPMLASEQYPKGLGATLPAYAGATEQACIAKTVFSCCAESSFTDALKATGAAHIIITGMETHVCVLQTALDLLDQGFIVHVVRDAVASRFDSDYAAALGLLERAGAVLTTTETLLFQMVEGAGGDQFKAISKLVRQKTM
jgi:nicotinamidase-related amidase